MTLKLLLQPALFCFMTICISSCRSESTNNQLLAELSNGLQSNNTNLAVRNEDVFIALQMKAEDIRTKEKAILWLPKAEQIKTISSGIINYLDSLRRFVADTTNKNRKSMREMFARNGVAKDIYLKLKKYKTEIFAVHPKLQYSLGELINRTLFNRDSLLSATEYQQKYFSNMSDLEIVSFLSLLQNKSLFVTNICLQWCHEQFTYHGDHYEAFEAIVGQNAQVLKAGNDLEITAGLGSFSRTNLPKVTIGGNVTALNERGYVFYRMRTSKRPGRYSVPIQFEFKDQDGKIQERTFNIEYTLVKSR